MTAIIGNFQLTDICYVVIISMYMQTMWHVEHVASPIAQHTTCVTIECDDCVVPDRSKTPFFKVIAGIESHSVPDPIGSVEHDDIIIHVQSNRRNGTKFPRWTWPVVNMLVIWTRIYIRNQFFFLVIWTKMCQLPSLSCAGDVFVFTCGYCSCSWLFLLIACKSIKCFIVP